MYLPFGFTRLLPKPDTEKDPELVPPGLHPQNR